MPNSLDDKAIVDAFVLHLNNRAYRTLKVDRRSDEENRESSDIDAIAGNLAIEHTSIDTFRNQRRDSARFSKVVRGLKSELPDQPKYRLTIILPYTCVQLGQDWPKIRDSLKSWIINSSPTLSDGMHHVTNAPGIPFEFRARKASGRKPGIIFYCHGTDDYTLPKRIREQLDRKVQKLKPYKLRGYSTILLVESNDIAFMNEDILLDAIRSGFSNRLPDGVDQVWYADTTIPHDLLFYDFTESIQ
jgi:hypothetical protein